MDLENARVDLVRILKFARGSRVDLESYRADLEWILEVRVDLEWILKIHAWILSGS